MKRRDELYELDAKRSTKIRLPKYLIAIAIGVIALALAWAPPGGIQRIVDSVRATLGVPAATPERARTDR